MNAAMDARHSKEVADADVAVTRVRQAAKLSAVLGLIGFVTVFVSMFTGNDPISEGVLLLAGTALATVVPAASLYAASYRTSLGAARLERSLDGE
jgi:hypothetical protein